MFAALPYYDWNNMSRFEADYLRDSYKTKTDEYFTSAQRDYVARLPIDDSARVLEIGCGNGATGALALASGKCGTYVGVEMFEPMAQIAAKTITRVHIGNVENMVLDYPVAHFDALICSEVLEHLVDPYSTLVRLVKLIRPGGLVLASSPNISHYLIIANLLRGKFEYSEAGAMDRTHLRWFTPPGYRQMFENANVETLHLQRLAADKVGMARKLLDMVPKPIGYLFWRQSDFIGQVR